MTGFADAGGAGLGQVFISLGVILAALAAAAWVVRRLRANGWTRRLGTASPITVIAARSIGWQASLVIVEAEGSRFLIGCGRGGITAVGVLAGPQAANVADAKSPAGAGS